MNLVRASSPRPPYQRGPSDDPDQSSKHPRGAHRRSSQVPPPSHREREQAEQSQQPSRGAVQRAESKEHVCLDEVWCCQPNEMQISCRRPEKPTFLTASGRAETQRRAGQPAFVGCICGLGGTLRDRR
jgi:hypothetical protein